MQTRRPAGGGSGGSGTGAGAKRVPETGSRSAHVPESASPERTGALAGTAGSNDTDTSAQANGYQRAAARAAYPGAAYPGAADVLEGEGSGSNPIGAALVSATRAAPRTGSRLRAGRRRGVLRLTLWLRSKVVWQP